MIKQVLHFLRLFALGLLLALPGLATASDIDTVDVRVTLDYDGTANISEHWVVDVDNKNTEWYLVQNGMKGMQITDFKVYDNDLQTYLTDDTPWNTKRSRTEKAGKSGIVTKSNDGYELCWGVGSSGKHHWTAEYKIKGFVKQYSDGCGFNHCFISDNLSSAPKYIRTTISLSSNEPLSAENARIWAFRYPGTCLFVNGKIVAENTKALSTRNSMIVMAIFPPDAFSSTNVIANDTIGSMKWRALEGSDYLNRTDDSAYGVSDNTSADNNEEDSSSLLKTLGLYVLALLGLLFFGFVVIPFIGIYILVFAWCIIWNIISLRPLRIYLRKKKLQKGALSKYNREIPLKGDLNRTFYILDETNYKILPLSTDNLIAAYIVRLMKLNAIGITSAKEEGKVVNRMQLAPNFDFSAQPNNRDTRAMKILYNLLKQASGKNLVLEKDELKKYLEKHKTQAVKLKGQLEQKDKSECKPEEYQQVSGLKNFLKDYSLIDERGAIEVALWDEYLVFATLFGMADQVIRDFKKYSPDYFIQSIIGAQLIDQNGEVISNFKDFADVSDVVDRVKTAGVTDSGYKRETSILSRDGGGGSSSESGGGGYSGGGGGGGR